MLELKNISKAFPGVQALDNVSLAFTLGEIHGLVGENGAGKSTCIKVICGIEQPDSGEIILNGNKAVFHGYEEAISNSISVVQQEIQVIPKSSIGENIMLDKLSNYTVFRKINWDLLYQESQKYLSLVQLDVNPKERIEFLGAAQKQLIQIAKALASKSRYLLLDEPTSSLTPHEAENLFTILHKLKAEGVAIIFVTHKLEELLQICDRISVLRDGKYVDTNTVNSSLPKEALVQLMLGRDVDSYHFGQLKTNKSEDVLRIENLTQNGTFENLNFALKRGEILGFYGLIGAGRTELAKIIIGEDRFDSGSIYKNGKRVFIKSVAESLHKYGIGYISENRKEEGLILDFPINTNINITIWQSIVHKITRFIAPRKEWDISRNFVTSLKIKTSSIHQKVKNLSGGNQQKVSISKWLAAECDVLIIDEPTVGVDVGAKRQIHELIWELVKKQSKSVILISSDLPEIISLSSRLLIFKEFKIVTEVSELSKENQDYAAISSEIGQYIS